MTNYEKLKQLLNDANFQKALTLHIGCSKIKLYLYEGDDRHYLLQLREIQIIDDEEVLIYIKSFIFQLNDRGSLMFFDIHFNDLVSPRLALETARTGQIIEDHLNSSL